MPAVPPAENWVLVVVNYGKYVREIPIRFVAADVGFLPFTPFLEAILDEYLRLADV